MHLRGRILKSICYFSILVLILTVIIIDYIRKDMEEPSIMIYRILGNDLPPRHSINQTLTNLQFILKHEPAYEKVRTIWVLNRIVNKDSEEEFIHLLKQYNRPYIQIPFYWKEYRQIPYYFPANGSLEKYLNSKQFSQLSDVNKIRLIDTIYYWKNLYVMNFNKARNVALEHGKRQNQARWLMILDSGCFLSREGYASLRRALMVNGSRRQYFIVPMIRLIDDNDAFHPPKIEAKDEPQIVFRRDSTIEFLETIRYGRGPKLEILFHLGVIKTYWRPFPWEIEPRPPLRTSKSSSDALFQYASFVFRLYSGFHPDNELLDKTRACSRLYGIFLFLETLELRLGRPKLLPTMPTMDSTHCTAWSDKQIKEIIRTARAIEASNSTRLNDTDHGSALIGKGKHDRFVWSIH